MGSFRWLAPVSPSAPAETAYPCDVGKTLEDLIAIFGLFEPEFDRKSTSAKIAY
jgi:hypothetical protein